MKDSLGDRIKEYEDQSRYYLKPKEPVIVRIDGKAFHTLTKHLDKPFDRNFILCMTQTAKALCEEIQGVKLAYTQSDEISLLLTDYDNDSTQGWFGYNLSKVVSVSASIATREFIKQVTHFKFGKIDISGVAFDARAFNIPKHEVKNYFHWRQVDAIRNSKNLFAQSIISHKKLQNKTSDEAIQLAKELSGQSWYDLDTELKQGSVVVPIKLKSQVLVPAGPNKGSMVDCIRTEWQVQAAPNFLKEYFPCSNY